MKYYEYIIFSSVLRSVTVYVLNRQNETKNETTSKIDVS
jgi:hypothetical protein